MEQKAIRNINDELSNFYGTENWYKHFTGGIFTDGIHHLREAFSCYWLIDDIFLYSKAIDRPVQGWTLLRVKESAFTLTCDNGNGKVLFSVEILSCDFAGDFLRLLLIDNVLLLPSEY